MTHYADPPALCSLLRLVPAEGPNASRVKIEAYLTAPTEYLEIRVAKQPGDGGWIKPGVALPENTSDGWLDHSSPLLYQCAVNTAVGRRVGGGGAG